MLRACRKMFFKLMLVLGLGSALTAAGVGLKPVAAAGAVELYTPYVKLSAPPGDTVSYSVDVINHGSSTATVDLGFDTKGNKWSYQLTAGGRTVSRLAIKPGETQTVDLELDVPLQVNKAVYAFQVNAGDATLPLAVDVTEQGTFSSELTTDQANMQGHSDSTFTFTATLRNRTAEKQTYALSAGGAAGWDVAFTSGSTSVTSVDVAPNAESSITITATPPDSVKAGKYEIPITASNNSTSAKTTVEADVTGTYGLKLSTPNDLLSTDVTAGAERKLDLVVTNTGTSDMTNVAMSDTSPSGWEVSFDPSTVTTIAAGQTAHVQATIKADKKALAGDYVVSLSAASAEKTANADIRVAVKTSVLWGWIGILIIIAVIGGIYYLFRKYGRR